MLTNKDMLEIAKKYLKKINGSKDDELVIITGLTIEKSYGNIYRYEFKRFIETGNSKYSVAIGAPFFSRKRNPSHSYFWNSRCF